MVCYEFCTFVLKFEVESRKTKDLIHLTLDLRLSTLDKKVKLELRRYIVPTIPMAVMLMFAVALVWFSDLFIQNSIRPDLNDKTFLSEINRFFAVNLVLSNIVSLLITALNAFFIGQLNNKYTIIRTRSFLPILFFVLLMATWHETHTIVVSHLALSLVLLSLFAIFGVYRNRNASEQAFLSSFLIAVASIFIEPLVLYIPLIWIGLALFYSLSFRNLLATIVGLLTPWILYLSVRFYLQPDLLWLLSLPESFELGVSVLGRPLNELIYMGILFVLSIIGFVGLSSNLNQDSMQTCGLINFNSWFLALSFIYSMIFVKQFFVFLPFVGVGLAILLAHPLTLKKSIFFTYIFLIFIFVNIVFVVSNLILNPR